MQQLKGRFAARRYPVDLHRYLLARSIEPSVPVKNSHPARVWHRVEDEQRAYRVRTVTIRH